MQTVRGFEIKTFGPLKNYKDNKNWVSDVGSLCSKYPNPAGKRVDVFC